MLGLAVQFQSWAAFDLSEALRFQFACRLIFFVYCILGSIKMAFFVFNLIFVINSQQNWLKFYMENNENNISIVYFLVKVPILVLKSRKMTNKCIDIYRRGSIIMCQVQNPHFSLFC